MTNENVVAAIGWSGDTSLIENHAVEWRMPTEGCILWSDNMVIPKGAPNTPAALELMNFVYRPKVQADIAEYVQYVTPVTGVKEIFGQRASRSWQQRADLPDRAVHTQLHDPARPARIGGGQAGRHRGLPGCDYRVTAEWHSPPAPVPYGLLGPGAIWLVLFFVVPMYYMGQMALRSGSLDTGGFTFTWEWSNFGDALSGHEEQLLRSFLYAGSATLIALAIAYPLAYAIALRAGRWKLLLLFAVVAPFFTTYLIRTIAWKTILADQSPAVDVLQFLHLVPQDGRVLATGGAVVAGLTYNFLPFMILPIYASLERMDVRLIEAAKDLYASRTKAFLKVTLPITAPGIVAGVLLTFIPAVGDYVNAPCSVAPARRWSAT